MLTEYEAKRLFETQPLSELIIKAKSSGKRFDNRISFYAPSFIRYDTTEFSNRTFDYPAISITGTRCALDCDHCGRKLLGSMIPANTPQELLKVCRSLEERGARGCLISGGADPDGKVPLKKFVDTIKRIKDETKLTLAVHTGLVDKDVAFMLGDAGVDVALIDVIGDGKTIEGVYHINAVPENFLYSMKHLKSAGVRIAPHVVVGLNYGKITGEFHALEMIHEAEPDVIVLVGLMPLGNTLMQGVRPPSPEDFGKIIAISRLMLPDTAIILGCARDRKTKHILDPIAVRLGVSAIAHPSEEAIKEAKKEELEVIFKPSCCAELALDMQSSEVPDR